MAIEKVLYRAHATATGGGRDGHSRTDDGAVDVKLVPPKEMGGSGAPGTNPEQLFATGYAGCFLGAIRFVAGKEKVAISPDAKVTASVGIGQVPTGFALEVDLQVSLPGTDKAAAQKLVDAAHIVCPYSNATRGNIDVKLTLV